MARRLDHLVPRERLVGRVAAARVALVEAPGGYGKTTLALAAASRRGGAWTRAVLDAPSGTVELAAELRRALAAAGLSDAVARLDGAAEPLAVLGEALASRPEPTLVVVDEVQRLLPAAAAALAEAVRAGGPSLRVVLCGRRMPDELARLAGQPGVTEVGPDDLAFDDDETAAVLRTAGRLDAEAAAERAPALRAALGGWPAAVVMAARRGGAGPAVAPRQGTALVRLVDAAVDELPDALRSGAATLAALPLFDERLLGEVFGPGAFAAVLDSGLALTERADGWYTLPDPVRDALAGRGRPDVDLVGRAAHGLRRAGHLPSAAELLARHGGSAALADLLAGCTPDELAGLGLARVRAYAALLAEADVARRPELLYLGAVAAERRDAAMRADWLARAATLAGEAHASLHRLVRAEQLVDAAHAGDPAQVVAAAEPLLATSDPAAPAARARALYAVAIARTSLLAPTARHELRPLLHEAAELLRLAGRPRWESEVLRRLGVSIEARLGAYERSVVSLTRALALLPAPDGDRARTLSYLAEGLEAMGRGEEAAAALREAVGIGERIGDAEAIWYAAWSTALMAARAGDLGTVDRSLRQVEVALGAVPATAAGLEYLLTVGDALAGAAALAGPGALVRARRLIDAARPLAACLDRGSTIAMADARLAAVDGDPAEAERLLDAIEGTPFAVPEQRWVRLLERAVAARRAGDAARSAALTAEALASAAEMGQPDQPARIEPGLLALLAEALAAGEPAAPVGLRLSLLGRFRVAAPDGDRTPAPGNPSALVALVALRGTLPAEEAIELLWPDVAPEVGRSRLRNLLNRVRERAGDLVVRAGDVLALADGAVVDVHLFERTATDALAAPADDRCGLARLALSHWTGELLPDQRYADWATARREQLRRRRLALLDVVVDDALGRDDLDEALRYLEQAIETEPLDERRHLQLVRALSRQGRRSAAAAAAAEARRVFDELGLPAAPELAGYLDVPV